MGGESFVPVATLLHSSHIMELDLTVKVCAGIVRAVVISGHAPHAQDEAPVLVAFWDLIATA